MTGLRTPERLVVQMQSQELALVPLTAKLSTSLLEAILESGDQLRRWMTWWHEDFTEAEAAQWASFCENSRSGGTHQEFAIQSSDCAYLGSVALSQVDLRAGTANLSYWTRSARLGQGVASAAVRRAAAYGVAELGLRRIEVAMATANVASRRVAERAGAVLEGILRSRVHVEGRTYNFAVYALTPEDFHADELTPERLNAS